MARFKIKSGAIFQKNGCLKEFGNLRSK